MTVSKVFNMAEQNHSSQETVLRPFEVTIPQRDGKGIAERVSIMVETRFDAEVGEWLLTPSGIRLIEDTKARYLGLLLPAEIKALRERFNLTQEQIGDILQIGRKTWTRWESGKQRPSQSSNLLLKLLQNGALTIEALKSPNSPPTDWSAVLPPSSPETLLMSFEVSEADGMNYSDYSAGKTEKQPLAA